MKLDPERTRHAINIAGVHCAAFRQARVGELSHWKGVAFANAARLGVYAALLARAGMTGPAPIFEGADGIRERARRLVRQCRPKCSTRRTEAMPGEGPASMILKTSIKYWPAEYHSQSAIEAALFLRKQIEDLSQVKSMVIESHDASVDIIGSEPEKWRPQTARDGGSQSALHHGGGVDRWRGDGQAIRARAFHGDRRLFRSCKNVKVERNDELTCALCRSGGEHRAREAGRRTHADEASRLSVRQREEPAEGSGSWKGNSSILAGAEDRRRTERIAWSEHGWKLDEAKRCQRIDGSRVSDLPT